MKHSAGPNNRFLSLTGVIVDLEYAANRMHPDMEEIKSRYFSSHPDDPVIMHRKEMVNRKFPFHALQDSRIEDAFNRDLLNLLREWEYSVITVCLDKGLHAETCTTCQCDPYHQCMTILLERFTSWLSRRQARGDVMAESRGGKEDRRLKESFTELWERGTSCVGPEQFQQSLTSRKLKVKPKTANVTGLQVADLIAHPSRCEILNDFGLLGRPLSPFAGQIRRILKEKYDQIDGVVYGKRFL